MRVDYLLRKPFLFALALCLIAATTASAQVAEVFIGSEKVVFEVFAENDGVILSVAGPCGVFTTDYKRGETPVIYIFDENGETLLDGNYTWELKTRPVVDPEITELLQSARKNGNDAAVALQLFKDGKLPTDITQFGYITVLEKNFVKLDQEQSNSRGTPAAKDFLINDDLIVDGSACVGFDCVNGESFGFDTLRLKENNLRIKFDDTSVAASFPRNDWQLTANDSANGGASKFSIDDISGGRTPFTVEANAPSHSLYVDDGGRIGNGTSTPSTEIHTVDGDTPTLRLQQDGSSGFAPQTWDVAGNETNFFIRDVTNGSTLPFRIRPGAPTSSIHIDDEGKVGLGTASPDADLHILDTGGNSEIQIETGSQAWKWRVNSANNQMNMIDDTNSTTPFRIAASAASNMVSLGVNTAGADSVNTISFGRDGSPNITVDIQGSVIVDGATEHADYVFESDFNLETITDHAAFMWQNKHLPALPKAPEGGKGRVDLVSHQMGVLEELEKAHIYIEQLHSRIGDLEGQAQEFQELRSLVQDLIRERTESE